MDENQLNNVQLIIRTLRSGNRMGSKEISEHLTELLGREIKVQDVASMLSRISNPEKCDLGYFIEKTSKGNSFIYGMAEEFQKVAEEKAYGLTLKTGKFKYPLDAVLEEHPELAKYVTKPRPRPRRGGGRRIIKSRMERTEKPRRGRPPKLDKVVKEPKKRGRKKKLVSAAVNAPAAAELMSGDRLERLAEAIRALAGLNNLTIHVNLSLSSDK